MRGSELLNKMDLISPEYIQAADRKSIPKRILQAGAVILRRQWHSHGSIGSVYT